MGSSDIAHEAGFFLTGGAALAGFHLLHRTTDDLDLFTSDEGAFLRGPRALQELANEIGATLELRQDPPAVSRRAVISPARP